jgi:hypothetical protein
MSSGVRQSPSILVNYIVSVTPPACDGQSECRLRVAVSPVLDENL